VVENQAWQASPAIDNQPIPPRNLSPPTLPPIVAPIHDASTQLYQMAEQASSSLGAPPTSFQQSLRMNSYNGQPSHPSLLMPAYTPSIDRNMADTAYMQAQGGANGDMQLLNPTSMNGTPAMSASWPVQHYEQPQQPQAGIMPAQPHEGLSLPIGDQSLQPSLEPQTFTYAPSVGLPFPSPSVYPAGQFAAASSSPLVHAGMNMSMNMVGDMSANSASGLWPSPLMAVSPATSMGGSMGSPIIAAGMSMSPQMFSPVSGIVYSPLMRVGSGHQRLRRRGSTSSIPTATAFTYSPPIPHRSLSSSVSMIAYAHATHPRLYNPPHTSPVVVITLIHPSHQEQEDARLYQPYFHAHGQPSAAAKKLEKQAGGAQGPGDFMDMNVRANAIRRKGLKPIPRPSMREIEKKIAEIGTPRSILSLWRWTLQDSH